MTNTHSPNSARDLFGPELCRMLRATERIEWFRIASERGQPTEGETIEGYPILARGSGPDLPRAVELTRALLSDGNYRWNCGVGCFPRPDVAVRLQMPSGVVNIIFCLDADLMEVVGRDPLGNVIRRFHHNFINGRPTFIALAKRAFPSDREIQGLREPVKQMQVQEVRSEFQRQLSDAVYLLRSGGLVAFPTETVYGLGADATNAQAVRRIFAAKGRPSTNPLIVHVSDAHVAKRYAKHWPADAEALAERFWPGPLTLVVPKSDAIVPAVTAGRDTVGIRAPDHPVALELLRAFDGPVAAPSANRSNRVSPTTAGHVRRELGDRVDLILDGGRCRVGIESTVLDLTRSRPVILRPGAVTREQIEAVVGPVDVFQGHVHAAEAAQSPGQQVIHYSPRTPAYRFAVGQAQGVRRWLDDHPDRSGILLLPGSRQLSDLDDLPGTRARTIEMPADPEGYARELYAALHKADDAGGGAIFVQMPPDEPQWAAVRDRLMRATTPITDE